MDQYQLGAWLVAISIGFAASGYLAAEFFDAHKRKLRSFFRCSTFLFVVALLLLLFDAVNLWLLAGLSIAILLFECIISPFASRWAQETEKERTWRQSEIKAKRLGITGPPRLSAEQQMDAAIALACQIVAFAASGGDIQKFHGCFIKSEPGDGDDDLLGVAYAKQGEGSAQLTEAITKAAIAPYCCRKNANTEGIVVSDELGLRYRNRAILLKAAQLAEESRAQDKPGNSAQFEQAATRFVEEHADQVIKLLEGKKFMIEALACQINARQTLTGADVRTILSSAPSGV